VLSFKKKRPARENPLKRLRRSIIVSTFEGQKYDFLRSRGTRPEIYRDNFARTRKIVLHLHSLAGG
jgi:hypothetical protein